MMTKSLAVSLLMVMLVPWQAGQTQISTQDSTAVVHVVDQFHDALVARDSVGAMALLAPEAVVLEGGSLETRPAYASGHLSADMEFMSGMKREITTRTIRIEGGLAWISTTSHLAGEYYGKSIESNGAELMILSRNPTGWLIEAIHWSSAR